MSEEITPTVTTPTQEANQPSEPTDTPTGAINPSTEPVANDKNDIVNSLLKEIEAEDKAKAEALANEKKLEADKHKDTIKQILRLQQEQESKLKTEYESKISELTNSFEELKNKMDTTSQGSKVPTSAQQAANQVGNEPTQKTPAQKHAETQQWWANRLREMSKR